MAKKRKFLGGIHRTILNDTIIEDMGGKTPAFKEILNQMNDWVKDYQEYYPIDEHWTALFEVSFQPPKPKKKGVSDAS